jgi:hypothetical protein
MLLRRSTMSNSVAKREGDSPSTMAKCGWMVAFERAGANITREYVERLPIAIRAGCTASNLHMSRRLCARPDNRHPVT